MLYGQRWNIVLVLFGYIGLFLPLSAHAGNNEHLEFWRSNYTVINPDSSPRAKRAYEIFQHVLAAAGSRNGVVPRLLIIKKETLEVLALPDGGVILSSGALDRCYLNSKYGDDRLAFLLAHEIAHQLKDDFWHMKFFQAVDDAGSQNKEEQHSLESVRKIASLTDQVLAKELEADEHGIIYATMAGYDPVAIVNEDGRVNFFAEWVAALDPARVPGTVADSSHPTPAIRAAAVKARLGQVLNELTVFNLGVWFYEAGEYERSSEAFREFMTYFPSREVYLDLAASEHQLALKYYQQWKGEPPVPFILSLTADPESRAVKVVIRGGAGTDPEEQFHAHLDKAVELYRTAIKQDPNYLPAYSNLASALIVNDQSFEAVGLLRRVVKQNPSRAAEIQSNLAIAYYYTDNLAKAEDVLRQILITNPKYPAALFNLAILNIEQGKIDDAKPLLRSYLAITPAGPWTVIARTHLGQPVTTTQQDTDNSHSRDETLGDVAIGAYDDEVPQQWGQPIQKTISLGGSPFVISDYPNGVSSVSRDGEIVLLKANSSYRGRSNNGIAIGGSISSLIHSYGDPSQITDLTQGEIWLYKRSRLAFRLRDGKVVSWEIFSP